MNSSTKLFQDTILSFYKKNGRHTLPWRETENPYHILVSEVMLQQTQVDRVIPKYNAFIDAFPTIDDLSTAPLTDVLTLWSGLGYNRRAKMLHEASKEMVNRFDGSVPDTHKDLESLPGVGPYTARAVMVFAYNKPAVLIETNIRSVFLHTFFQELENVSDTQLVPLIKKTMHENPREWYAALMDYGAHLKRTTINPNRKSAHYVQQSPFKGSVREVRGRVINVLIQGPRTTTYLQNNLPFPKNHIHKVLSDLQKEGLILQDKRKWRIS
tara:strand:+ start:11849 stop:12655 length:807 start_codon:yes stop_codon:yes gene_type:complete